MVTCVKCHETYADAVKFCPRDGSPLGATAAALARAPTMTCPRCGATFKEIKFCVHDGTALEAAS